MTSWLKSPAASRKEMACAALLTAVVILICSPVLAVETPKEFASPISDKAEPMMAGKFAPTWESLQQYECPTWFRNAKFGLWALGPAM